MHGKLQLNSPDIHDIVMSVITTISLSFVRSVATSKCKLMFV